MSKAHSAVEATCEKFQKLETTNRALIEALEGLLMSADCEWENQRLGHDWAEACEKARATLKQAKGESE